MKRTTVLTIAFLLLSSLAFAETIEVALPGLHGVYPVDPSNGERTTVFQFRKPAIIHSVSLRLSGTTTVGTAHCLDNTSSRGQWK